MTMNPVQVEQISATWNSQPDCRLAPPGKIGVPTMIADGVDDKFVRQEHGKELAALIPGRSSWSAGSQPSRALAEPGGVRPGGAGSAWQRQ
jgi:hypothetical protein